MTRRVPLLLAVLLGGAVAFAPGVAAGGFCHADPAARMKTSSAPRVTMIDCAFETTVTYVDPGEKVRWVNKDRSPHTVTGAALSWGTEEMLDMGDAVTYSFEEEGVFPYYCELHPAMVGAVVVGDGGGPAGAAGTGVKPVDDAAPVAATRTAPAETSDGVSPAVLALALAAAAGGLIVVTRAVWARRAGAASAS